MELKVKRTAFKDEYTIGHLYINDKYFCDTLEDTDRGLTQNTPISVINSKKVKGKTCIPYGTYDVTLDVVSTKYSNYSRYKFAKEYGAKIPRVLNVPGFDGILIHPGNKASDTEGCLLVGENKVKGQVINSLNTWKKLYAVLKENKKEGIKITYTK